MSNVPATTAATVKKNVARICHFRRIRIAAISLSETVLPFSTGFMDPHLICRAACAGRASLGLEKRVRLACGPDRATRVPDSGHADETACATIFRVGFTFLKKVSKLPPLKSHQTGLRFGKRELLSTPGYLTRHNIVKRQTPMVYHTATVCQDLCVPVRIVWLSRRL